MMPQSQKKQKHNTRPTGICRNTLAGLQGTSLPKPPFPLTGIKRDPKVQAIQLNCWALQRVLTS